MAAKHKTKAKTASAPVETVTAYKGFDANWQCRGFQYAIGQTYTMDGEVKACERGFHACEYPLEVFEYYQPADSRFAEVKLSGAMHRDGGDTKIAAASITVVAELSIADMAQRAWERVRSRATAENSVHVAGDQSAAVATGAKSAALATGWLSAASATGIRSAALASGVSGRVSGKAGCAIFLVERIDDCGPDHGKIVWEFCGKAGGFGIAISDTGEVSGPHTIKPDTFYTLKGGKPVEVA